MPRSRYSYGPLREVVGRRSRVPGGLFIEQYECGHEWPERQDIYGPTGYGTRRCWQCREDKPVVPYEQIQRT